MSAGTPLRAFRIPDHEWEAAEFTVNKRNDNSRNPPWTMSAFIRLAIREKIKKMIRSRTRYSSRRRVKSSKYNSDNARENETATPSVLARDETVA
jgi:mRNA deadenylase 3'-5' endonuclease subunit Ccr4